MKASPFVYQKSVTAGAGNLVLTLVTGYRTFADAFPSNSGSQLFFYTILDKATGAWEEGLGYMSGSSLVRSQIIAGSNGTSPVNFAANPKEVTCDVASTAQEGILTVKALTDNYTLSMNDSAYYLRLSNAAAKAITVPPNADVAFPIGTKILGCQTGAGQVSITPGSGVTINTPETLKMAKQYSQFTLKKTGTNIWDLEGDLEVSQTPVYVPPGAVLDFAGTTAPSGFVLCYGQAISRTTYALLFSAVGTTYGAGDGVNTFNVPDCRGRTVAGKDDMGGTSANRLTGTSGGVNGDNLGATGGGEQVTLTTTEMPAHTHISENGVTQTGPSYGSPCMSGTGSVVGGPSMSTEGGGGAHNNVQPTIIFNKIIKT